MNQLDQIEAPHPLRPAAIAGFLLVALAANTLHGQGLQDPTEIDKIIGSDVQEEEVEAEAGPTFAMRAEELFPVMLRPWA